MNLGNPENLFCVEGDISSEESCGNLYKQVNRKWGTLEVVVNNAGSFPILDFEEITSADWRKVMGINLDGCFLMTRALLPLLKKSSAGRIIHISSGSFFNLPPNQAHDVTSKAGVIWFTRAAAVSLGKYHITVNAITPGLTATAHLVVHFPSEMMDRLAQQGALKKGKLPMIW